MIFKNTKEQSLETYLNQYPLVCPMKIVVTIPAYNEESNIGNLLISVLNQRKSLCMSDL